MMSVWLGIPAIVLVAGVVGSGLLLRGTSQCAGIITSFEALAAGFGVISLALFLLALAGAFVPEAMLALLVVWIACCAMRIRKFSIRVDSLVPLRHLASWLGFSILACSWYEAVPPFDARLNSSDASVYLGAARQLADFGSLVRPDPLVLEMTPEERSAAFGKNLSGRSSSYHDRFPGGVQLVDRDAGLVSFNFYHLWPVWLALGMMVVGPDFVSLLTVFTGVGMAALFMLALRLGGRFFAIATVAVVFLTYPEQYYSSIPLSEIPSQAFFLAGLLCFVTAAGAPQDRRLGLSVVAMLLWGSFFLMRLDGAVYVLPCLAVCFFMLPALRRDFGRWAPFILGLAAIEALAILHQAASNSYELPSALAGDDLSRWLSEGGRWIRPREQWVAIGWSIAFVAAWWFTSPDGASWRQRTTAVSAAAVLACSLLGLGLVLTYGFEWEAPWRHFQWLRVYFSDWLLGGVGLGIALVIAATVGCCHDRTERGILLVFGLLSLLIFLIAPLVSPYQPWAIRRAVPIALPSMLAASLLGWKLALSMLARRLHPGFEHAHLAIAALALLELVPKNDVLWREPLYFGVTDQVDRLVDRLPRHALVVLADVDAGTQLQIGLQYEHKRSTIVLPAGAAADDPEIHKLRDFLRRQASAGKPLFALVQDSSLIPTAMVSEFALKHAFSEQIRFTELRQVGEFNFPRVITRKEIRYHAFEAVDSRLTAKTTVNVGIPAHDLPYLIRGFHAAVLAPDGTMHYRWTTDAPEFQLPRVRKIRIMFHRSWRPESVPLNVTALVDGVPAPVRIELLGNDGAIEITLPPGVKRDPAVQLALRFDPFTPKSLGLSNDDRTLGVAISRIDLID